MWIIIIAYWVSSREYSHIGSNCDWIDTPEDSYVDCTTWNRIYSNNYESIKLTV